VLDLDEVDDSSIHLVQLLGRAFLFQDGFFVLLHPVLETWKLGVEVFLIPNGCGILVIDVLGDELKIDPRARA